jgi:hypothetical protein
MLAPFVGTVIVKAEAAEVVDGMSRTGSVIGSVQISFVTVYYVQDEITNTVYTYSCQTGTQSFNLNDKVQFDLYYSTSGKILIKSIIRK